MKTIWKYELETTDSQKIEMVVDAKILCVQTQGGNPCLWAEVEGAYSAHTEEREILIFGTGNDVCDHGDYIGTYQMHDGALVFHVFEGIKQCKNTN